MKKILVTGGLGFIGSNLIRLLLLKKFKVINIDNKSYSSSSYNTKNFKNDINYQFIKVDINNKKKLIQIFKKFKPDGIFNLAASTHVDRSIENQISFINNNILGTYNLLEALRNYSKINKNYRLIHVSTDEIYGDISKGSVKENSQVKPSSPYAATKAASNHLVSSYIKTFKLKALIVNPTNNYGPNQHPEKLIPKIIYNILNNKKLPIYGKGKNKREWIFVSDNCEALIAVYKNGKIGESYNIGSGKIISNLAICKLLMNIAKKNKSLGQNVKIQFIKDRPGHDFRYSVNSSKIKKKIKWKPKVKLLEGLKYTFNWYVENKKYFNSFNKKDFTRRIG